MSAHNLRKFLFTRIDCTRYAPEICTAISNAISMTAGSHNNYASADNLRTVKEKTLELLSLDPLADNEIGILFEGIIVDFV